MKRMHNFPQFFYLVFFVGLFSFYACGDTEDESVGSMDEILLEEFRWPAGTTGDLWELTDADVAELLETNPPPDWSLAEDLALRKEYYFAQLLKQFGDIPEVRYIIAFERKTGKNITRKQAIAYSEAKYRLFPNEKNLEALQYIKTLPVGLIKEPDTQAWDKERELAKEDPDKFVEIQRERFIRNYGDIPEVHTYIEILRKILKRQPLTDEEKLAREKAIALFQSLDAQRENTQGEVPDD